MPRPQFINDLDKYLYKFSRLQKALRDMATTKQLVQDSEDIVWDSKEDAYAAARNLMFAAMRNSVLPFKVHYTCHWAKTQAAVHEDRAKAFQRILLQIKCEDDALGVRRLANHHELIAARYKAVANAMQD